MQYRIGVCDDEPLQVKVNGLYIKELSKKNKLDIVLHGFTNPAHLIPYMETEGIDILFLDIDMGESSGIALAATFYERFPNLVIVFVTGHKEFANDAFDVDAMGYIMKPVDEKKLERALLKATRQVAAIHQPAPETTLVITEENLKKKINQKEIIHVERQQSKSIIHTPQRDYGVYETITALHERLEKYFLRISQSDIVNIHEITEIKNNQVYLKNKTILSIGRTYKKDVMEAYLKMPVQS